VLDTEVDDETVPDPEVVLDDVELIELEGTPEELNSGVEEDDVLIEAVLVEVELMSEDELVADVAELVEMLFGTLVDTLIEILVDELVILLYEFVFDFFVDIPVEELIEELV
jgi:hypothetical protein